MVTSKRKYHLGTTCPYEYEKRLKKIAEKKGTNLSHEIREAIEDHIKQWFPEWVPEEGGVQ